MTNANYNCTQAELYVACELAWKNCKNHLADFTNYKPFYTETYCNARLQEIKDAEKMPDEQTRDEVSESLRIILSEKARICLNKWQDLKRYIADAFPDDLQKPKLEAAGSEFYRKASQENWEVLKTMLVTANEFIADNTAALSANNNMPAAFPAAFDSSKTEFENTYSAFLLAEEEVPVDASGKIKANNAIYDKTIAMCLDGQRIFISKEEIQKKFIWEELIALVTSPGPAGLKGTVKNTADNQPLADAELTLVELEKTTNSDTNGEFDFGNIASGTYTLKVKKNGFAEQQFTIQILKGTTPKKEIGLNPL